MDSLTHVALGAAVGIAAMGRRTAPWKAALWGAVCNTLPDLDVFIPHPDPVRDMTFHRAESHAFFWLTLAAPLLGWLAATLMREGSQWRRWIVATWLALVAHPLLDALTVYGTQVALPFTVRPFGAGSVFIIDPLVTLPLMAGVLVALVARPGAWRWNGLGLALAVGYLGWGLGVQQHVRTLAEASLRQQGIAFERVLVTPTAFNTVLWRVVAMAPDAYHEGYHSLLDDGRSVAFERHDRGATLQPALAGNWAGERMAWFSRGFYALDERDGRLAITDLRMGQWPYYMFRFVVAERGSGWHEVKPHADGRQIPVEAGLQWLWRRMRGEPVPPPR
jgi:inner membrane protein